MARGRKSTPEHIIRQCFILQDELKTYSAIGRRLDLAPNTVKSILNNKDYIAKYGDLMQEIAKINKNSNIEILEMLNSHKYSDILSNALELLTKENMQTDFEKSGLRNIINLQGNIIDKLIKLKELELRKLEAERRESIHLHIDNNIGNIMELMNNPIPLTVKPEDEIEEFKS